MGQNLSAVDSFLMGYKPSCYENVSNLSSDETGKLSKYPHYQASPRFVMYFQTDSLKEMFLSRIKGLDNTSPQYIKVFGDALGYPPKAASFFADYHARRRVDVEGASKYFKRVKVNMLYCGIQFMSHVEDLEENAHWLWDRYQHEKPMRFKLFPPESDPIQFVIPYLDKDQLRESINDCVICSQPPTATEGKG